MKHRFILPVILLPVLLIVSTPGISKNVPPSIIGEWGAGQYRDLCRMGGFLFCAANGSGIDIYEITDPAHPALISSIPLKGNINSIVQQNQKLFVASDSDGLLVYNVISPTNPVLLGTYIPSVNRPVMDMIIDNSMLFMILDGAYLEIVDITDPAKLTKIFRKRIGYFSSSAVITKKDDRIYMGVGREIYIVDVTDPANSTAKGRIELEAYVQDIVTIGNMICVGIESPFVLFRDALSIWDVSDMENPMLISEIPDLPYISSLAYSDPYVFATNQDFLSINVSDPASPVIESRVNLDSWPQCTLLIDDIAWIASWTDGLMAFDVSHPEAPVLCTQKDRSIRPYLITSMGDTVLLAGRYEGVTLLDISNPSSPFQTRTEDINYLKSLENWFSYVFMGSASRTDIWDYWLQDHAYQVAANLVASNQQVLLDGLAINAGGSTLFFTDLEDLQNPQLLSQLEMPAPIVALDAIEPYAFVADEAGLFRVIRFADPENPATIASCDLGLTATDMKKVRNRVFVSSMEGPAQCVDVSDPESPILMAPLPVPEDTLSLDTRYPELAICRQTGEIMFMSILETETPTRISSINTNTEPEEVTYYGNSLLVAGGNSGRFLIVKPPQYDSGHFFLPHIANNNDWQTYLVAENMDSSNTQLTVKTTDGTGQSTEIQTETIPAGQTITIPLTTGEMGELQTSMYGRLNVQIGYRHSVEHGIAAFNLDDNSAKVIHFNMPSYLNDHLTWMGIALANPSDRPAAITLKAFDNNGTMLSVNKLVLPSHRRIARVLSDLFYGLDWKLVARIKAESNEMISGICISGNGNAQLLFTKATTGDPKPPVRYLPHIATQFDYWQNSLVLDNTGSLNAYTTLLLFAEGQQVHREDIAIPERSTITISLNDFASLGVDSGILTNCSPSLNARLVYVYKSTGGTAEFLTGDQESKELVYSFPSYAADSLTWMGLAVFNTEESTATVIMRAFRNGDEVGSTDVVLEGHGKKAFLLEQLFGSGTGAIDRVTATSETNLCGLNISGFNQDRYLFTKARIIGE